MDPVLKRKKPEFDYSFNTTIAEIIAEPSILRRRIEKLKIICTKCHKLKTIKFNKTEVTIKCECGTNILFPPRTDRQGQYLSKFISARDFNARKNNK